MRHKGGKDMRTGNTSGTYGMVFFFALSTLVMPAAVFADVAPGDVIDETN